MQKLCCCVLTAGVLVASGSAAEARELTLTIANGRVTLIAHDVTVRQILDEWARVGQTRIVNGEKLLGAPMTIELRDVPEGKALETVLRSAAGYLVAPREAGNTGASLYDRVLILPTSRPPAVTSAPVTQFTRPPLQPQPQPMPVVDDDSAPEQTPPGTPVAGQPFPGPAPQQPTQPGMQQPVNTLPRPGMLPPAPTGPGNPYQPQPIGRPPAPGGGRGGAPTGPGGVPSGAPTGPGGGGV
jgi:hypothetical protein